MNVPRRSWTPAGIPGKSAKVLLNKEVLEGEELRQLLNEHKGGGSNT